MKKILLLLVALINLNELFALPTLKKEPQPLVIVSCSGKSGSSTLQASFQRLGFETRRRHALDENMYAYILKREKEGPVLLIDSIRDMISRKIASFFQNLSQHTQIAEAEILANYQKDRVGCLNFLLGEFHKKLFQIANLNTFQFWNRLNYSCLRDGSFDFEKKYQLKKIGNLYFLNLRFDDIQNWQKIIKSLDLPFDLRQFTIQPSNLSQEKWYKDIYRDFLKNFKISQADFDAVLQNSAAELHHFYTPEEIQKFIDKWKPYIYN